jgi:hypothetical protein
MRKFLLLSGAFLAFNCLNAQDIEIRVRQTNYDATDPDGAGPATGQVTFAFDLKSTSGDILADGIGLSVAYQSKYLMAPAGNTFTVKEGPINNGNWTQNVDNRAGNDILPASISYGSQTFDKRMIIAFSQSSGVPDATISGTNWTEVARVTYYTLGTSIPQGGYITPETGITVPQNSVSSDGGLTSYAYLSPNLLNPVALGSGTLPVEFTRFSVECSGAAGSIVRWATATERNNSHFEVERSNDGTTWTSVGRVNSNSSRTYEFVDKTGGQAIYRIKQVDLNGAVSYTTLVRSSCNTPTFFVNLYPVPARDKLTLVIGSDKQIKTTVQVMDNSGRVVMTVPLAINKGTNNFTLDVNNLSQGQYYIRGSEAGLEINQRFTITR